MYPVTEEEEVFFMELCSIKIQGNPLPYSWFKTIKNGSNGKPNLFAIMVLSEIVHQYVPYVQDGQLLKSYKDDILQTSFRKLGGKFCFTNRQTKEALDCLVELGVIEVEMRRDDQSKDAELGFVPHVRLFVDRLEEISCLAEHAA